MDDVMHGALEDITIVDLSRVLAGPYATQLLGDLGALSQFSPGHFREHFEEEAEGTLAQGAVLDIVEEEDPMDPDALHVLVRSVDLEFPDGDG